MRVRHRMAVIFTCAVTSPFGGLGSAHREYLILIVNLLDGLSHSRIMADGNY